MLRRLSLVVLAFLLVSFAGPASGPASAAQADDPIEELVERLRPVYSNLDADDIKAIQDARGEVQGLSDVELDDLLEDLVTPEVEAALGPDAKDNVRDMVRQADDIYYSTDAQELKASLEGFKSDWQDEIALLLPGIAIDELWAFALSTEEHLPEALMDNVGDILENLITQKSYDEVAQTFADVLESAMQKAMDHHPDFEDKLDDLGWDVELLVEVKNGVRDEVDPDKRAEQALMKGYVRSVTKPSVSTSMYVGTSRAMNLVVLPDHAGGFPVSGVFLDWESSNTNVAYFKDKNILVAKATGTTTITAVHPQADESWGWLAKFDVTVKQRPSGPSAPEAPPPTLPQIPDISDLAERSSTQNPDGTTTWTTSLGSDEIKQVLEDYEGEMDFVLDLDEPMDPGDEQEILISAEGLALLSQAEDSLTITTPYGSISIPPGWLDLQALAEQLGASPGDIYIRMVIRRPSTDQTLGGLNGKKPVGDPVEISIEAVVNGKVIQLSLGGPASRELAFPVELASAGPLALPGVGQADLRCDLFYTAEQAAGVRDERMLGAYKYDETLDTWNYVRSFVDTENDVVTFYTVEPGRYCIMAYQKTFADIAGHWAQPELELMASRHVFKGLAPDVAGPDLTVTRAQFATMLARALDIEAEPDANPFADVPDDAWFSGAVSGAVKAGLISGYEDGTFKPDEEISRTEMAAILARALRVFGERPSPSTAEAEALLAGFADGAQVASWARRDMAAAVEAGLIKGMDGNRLEPLGTATRAQAAVTIARLMDCLAIF